LDSTSVIKRLEFLQMVLISERPIDSIVGLLPRLFSIDERLIEAWLFFLEGTLPRAL
jgi:hypothetical protein